MMNNDDSITVYPDHLCVVHVKLPFKDEYAKMYHNLLGKMFNRYHIAIDMTDMPSIDGAGLSALLRLHKESHDFQRKFFIMNPPPDIVKQLDIAMISCVVPTKLNLADIRKSVAGEGHYRGESEDRRYHDRRSTPLTQS